MLTKNDFTPENWAALRETPHLVGVATMIAGASGLGTIKESIAAAQTVMEGQSKCRFSGISVTGMKLWLPRDH